MLEKLRKLLLANRDFIKNKYKRVLPIGDYISDRWEKAEYLGFGKNSSIYDSSLVLGKVEVGTDCWIGPFTILDGSGDVLKIGNNCDISAGVQIYTHNTVSKVIEGRTISTGKVLIGNNCYIGPNVVISQGVTIGDFVVIGANSFVNKDIPSNSKAFGTPITIRKVQSKKF